VLTGLYLSWFGKFFTVCTVFAALHYLCYFLAIILHIGLYLLVTGYQVVEMELVDKWTVASSTATNCHRPRQHTQALKRIKVSQNHHILLCAVSLL